MTAFLVGLVMAVGILGTVLPILPGLVLIWGAALVYGLVEGFGLIGWVAFGTISLIAAAGVAAGIVVPQRAAWAGGIGVGGQLLALALAVVGFFVIPVVGAGAGFVLGVYLVARSRHPEQAWSVTKSTLRSMVVAAGLQFVAGVTMTGVWLVWVFAS